MAQQVLNLKQHDTAPLCRVRLLDGTQPVQGLASAIGVKLILRRTGVAAPVVNAAMVVEDQTANAGWVHRLWDAPDTATAGLLRGEVEVTWSDGSVQTFPPNGYFMINISEDLG